MDEIDSKALTAAVEEHYAAGFKETPTMAMRKGIETYLTASGLTSKLAALEDENKTLRELLHSQKSWVPYHVWQWHDEVSAALSKPAALPDFRYCDGCDGYNCDAEKGCAYPGAAALPDEGKGESEAVGEEELAKVLVKVWGYKWVNYEDFPTPDHPDRKRFSEAYSMRLNAQDAVRGLLRRFTITRPVATPPAPQPLEGAVKATRSPADWFSFLTSHADSEGNIPRDRFGKLARALSSLSPAPQPVGEVRATHRHKKTGGEYVLLGIGKMQTAKWREPYQGATTGSIPVDLHSVAIYRSVTDGHLWVRPREEFEDGRFETLSASPSPAAQEDGE